LREDPIGWHSGAKQLLQDPHMRPFVPALFLSALVPLSTALAEEIPGSQYEAGNWSGAAHTDDRGGFSHCAVSVGFVNGQTVWIGVYPNDTLSILFSQPEVRFQPGQKFELWVMMETGLPNIGNGEAWDESFAGITYDGIQATVDFLNSGRYLRMLGMGIDDGFDIDGITPALALAQECLASQGGGSSGKVLGSDPGAAKLPPKVPDLSKPKTSGIGSGGGLGSRPGGALGTPAPKPQP
jgi:hypothetical protein